MYIESINIDDYVNDLVISIAPRNQTKSTNLLGDRVIDRGKLKYEISFKINLISNAEWSPLLEVLKRSSFNVTFYDAHEGEITREFSIDSIPSSRFIIAGDVVYYRNISLKLEEL